MNRSVTRKLTAVALACVLTAGTAVMLVMSNDITRVRVTAHFATTNGLYAGDQVRILGIPVGEIDNITPGPSGSQVTFWFDSKYKVPAAAEAAILAPGLVSARVIQLTPAYTGGPVMADNAVIPQERTAVPVEYDELRVQLEKINQSMQPTGPDGVSPAGALINTGAENLRGQGADIRRALTELSQALSAVGDHSKDISGTVKNLSVLVSALGSSADVLGQLNSNLAAVTGLLDQHPDALGAMVRDLDVALKEVDGFVADNRDALGTSTDKLSSITAMLHERIPEIKQILHVSPNSLSNFANVYRPATASFAGTFAVTNFANPLQFICSGVQAASRLNYEQSSKLCVQYLAPIFKNREYNYPPVGTTLGLLMLPVAGAMARPNEITYSEDRMRPDYVPPAPEPAVTSADPGGIAAEVPGPAFELAPAGSAQNPVTPDPSAGLPGLMLPTGAG